MENKTRSSCGLFKKVAILFPSIWGVLVLAAAHPRLKRLLDIDAAFETMGCELTSDDFGGLIGASPKGTLLLSG